MQHLRHISLKDKHTLQADAVAQDYFVLDDPAECAAVAPSAFILGGGSNVIFLGEVSRPVVHLNFARRGVEREDGNVVRYYAQAGATWHDVVMDTVAQGLYGLENLALIPGTVGAAPVQNIGAYGVEVGDVIDSLEVFDRITQQVHRLGASECAFAYRQSHFKGIWQQRYIIIGVRFRLHRRGELSLGYPDLANMSAQLDSAEAVAHAVCAIRQQKLPDPMVEPNAGSFFHNPIVTAEVAAQLKANHPDMPLYTAGNACKLSAAWMVEQCGWRGVFDGKVGMSARHALVLVNHGGSGEEILAFASHVQDSVFRRFAVALHIEPTIVGG